jgi:hypothetical protein
MIAQTINHRSSRSEFRAAGLGRIARARRIIGARLKYEDGRTLPIRLILPAVRTDTQRISASTRETRMHAGAAVRCLARIELRPFAAGRC